MINFDRRCVYFLCKYIHEEIDGQERKFNNLNNYSINVVTLKYAFQLAVMIDNHIIIVCLCCHYHRELNNTFRK